MSLVNIIFTTLMTASIKDYSCCKFKLHVSKYTAEPHLRISTTLSRCNYLIIMATINGIQKDMQAFLISMLKLIFSLSDFDLQCTSVTNDLLNLVFFRFLAFVNYHSWGPLVNILKNWTFSYRDNTFLTILDRLRSVFHESKILVRKTALYSKLDTKFI